MAGGNTPCHPQLPLHHIVQQTRMPDIDGRRIAVLATDGVEEVELVKLVEALSAAGATVTLLSLKAGRIQAMNEDVKPAGTHPVDPAVAEADAGSFDGLLLPGGTTSSDKLRLDENAVGFVKASYRRTSRSRPSATAPGC